MSNWFVIRTNIKCETKAKSNLNHAGFGVYLPEMKIEHQHRRTKKWITRTLWLMPRYLFVEMPAGEHRWRDLRACEGVELVLGAYGASGEVEPFSVPSRVIERMMSMQINLQFDQTREAKARHKEIGKTVKETTRMQFPPGVRVRAKDGPFASFEGLVSGVTARGEVEVMIEIFGRLTPSYFLHGALEKINQELVDEFAEAA